MRSWLSRLHIKIVNSNFWFHVYYKHTKAWKKQVAGVEKRALEFRARCEAEDERLGIKYDDI